MSEMNELFIQDNQIISISTIKNLFGLEILDASNNNITDFEEIVNISELENLRIVNFIGNVFAENDNYLEVVKEIQEEI